MSVFSRSEMLRDLEDAGWLTLTTNPEGDRIFVLTATGQERARSREVDVSHFLVEDVPFWSDDERSVRALFEYLYATKRADERARVERALQWMSEQRPDAVFDVADAREFLSRLDRGFGASAARPDRRDQAMYLLDLLAGTKASETASRQAEAAADLARRKRDEQAREDEARKWTERQSELPNWRPWREIWAEERTQEPERARRLAEWKAEKQTEKDEQRRAENEAWLTLSPKQRALKQEARRRADEAAAALDEAHLHPEPWPLPTAE